MKLSAAKKAARELGRLCQQKPNSVDASHWEALNFCRGVILKSVIKKQPKRQQHGHAA